MEENPRSRRATLRTLTLSLLGGAGLWRFLTPRARKTAADADAVSVPEADVPAEGALVLPQHRVAVVREGGSLVALDLTCTHLGCTVKGTEQGFSCPCHGSRFAPGGELLNGPAPRALKRLRLGRQGGTLRVARG
jgi:Rieske Fe-S protein